MDKLILTYLPGAALEELIFIEEITEDFSDGEREEFLLHYRDRRAREEMIVILCALGFVGFSGLHRLYTRRILLGLAFFFTAGFCFIGTIVDLINHRSITREYNRNQALDLYSEMSYPYEEI